MGLSREPSLTTEPFSSQIISQNTQWDQKRRMKTLMSVLKVASVFLFPTPLPISLRIVFEAYCFYTECSLVGKVKISDKQRGEYIYNFVTAKI